MRLREKIEQEIQTKEKEVEALKAALEVLGGKTKRTPVRHIRSYKIRNKGIINQILIQIRSLTAGTIFTSKDIASAVAPIFPGIGTRYIAGVVSSRNFQRRYEKEFVRTGERMFMPGAAGFGKGRNWMFTYKRLGGV